MIITMLYENNRADPQLECGHGLSMLVATGEQTILFDTGAGAAFAHNAAALGHSLAKVQLAVLSHAHNDHAGGIKTFLTANPDAPVYVGPGAFARYYEQQADGSLAYIGLEPDLAGHPRLVENTTGQMTVGAGLTLFALPPEALRSYPVEANQTLMAEGESGPVADAFLHEQSLLVAEGDKRVLFCGCAHSGVVSIMQAAEALCGGPLTAVLGGFHLHNPTTGQQEAPALVDAIGRELAARPTRYYTFHCTGPVAYRRLQRQLGPQLATLATGDVLTL